MAQVYKRAGSNGKATWYIRYREPGRKDIRKATKAKTRREAELVLFQVLDQIAQGTYETRERQRKVSFFEICDDFLAYGKAHKRSWKRDEFSIDRMKSYFGNISCDRFTRSMIERYVADRKNGEGIFPDSVKPATINRELTCLKTIFNRAYQEEKMAKNLSLQIKLLQEDNVRDRVLNQVEFQQLLFSASNHLKPVLITAWETGMRRGEILSLTWEMVKMRKKIFQIPGENTKTGRKRIIPMSPFLVRTFSRLPRKSEFVFMYKRKQLRDIRNAFTRACHRARIEDFRFHDLRHCFVTRMRRNGIPDRVIMAITGHQTMECFQRYDTISVDDLKEAVGADLEPMKPNIISLLA